MLIKAERIVCLLLILFNMVFIVGSQTTSAGEESKDKFQFAGDRIKFSIDFRYRHEQIDQEDYDMRVRNRFRLRVGALATATDEIDIGFRLASGSSSDPVSTNQTLDEGFSKKPVWIDLAYFDYHPKFIEGLNFIGGKMENPFLIPAKTDLIWDHDLTPEGLTFKYKHKIDPVELFINVGGFWVKERSAKLTEDEVNDNDSGFLGGLTGLKFDIMENFDINAGVGYFHFINMASDKNTAYETLYDSTKGFGNSTFTNNKTSYYIHDYHELEAYLSLNFKAGDIPFMVYGDYVNNLGVDKNNWYCKETKDRTGKECKEEDMGWMTGFQVGKCKDKNSWELNYNYRFLEADAVVGAFTDSDSGNGGTDHKGHKVSIAYQLFKNWNVGFTFFDDKLGLNLEEDEKAPTYKRYQFDFVFKI